MLKKVSIFTIILTLSLIMVTGLRAEDNSDQKRSEIEKQIADLEEKLKNATQQKNTLSSQLQFMDTQKNLTELRMQETEKKMNDMEKEINVLGARIEGLDTSLDTLSKSYIERLVYGYKKRSFTFLDVLLDSDNASDLLNNYQYYKVVQENNQKVLLQVQQTKLNFEEQKDLRERKRKELDALQEILAKQKEELQKQAIAKQRLLSVTQSDEQTYQRLLESAKQQLNSFKSFASSAGAGTIGANAFGSGSDGNYYSQRDSRWASKYIGASSETVLDVGCLLTSISMVAKKNGANVTPLDIASDSNRFFGNTAYMLLPWPGVAGKGYRSVSDIDSELNSGNYVIAGVKRTSCAYGGDHFVVLTKKDGDDYIMHDPIYGPDIKFKSHYSTICSSATFK